MNIRFITSQPKIEIKLKLDLDDDNDLASASFNEVFKFSFNSCLVSILMFNDSFIVLSLLSNFLE